MSERATLPIAGEFPPTTEADWIAAVRKVVLKGRPADGDTASDDEFAAAFERQLVTQTPDGIAVQPLYTSGPEPDAHTRGARSAPSPWEIRQRVHPGGSAVEELESGATGVLVEVPGDVSVEQLGSALAGVHLEMAPVSLATPGDDDGISAANRLIEVWDAAGTAATDRTGSLGADPIGAWARSGGVTEIVWEALGELVERVAGSPARAYVADGTVWHEAGATPAQELAWNVAAARTAVRAVPAVTRSIELRWAADADQFMTIAKLRAARQLWARAAGSGPGFHHAETSLAMLTRYDTWTNALRSTVACFAAGVGGADAVTVWPHDALVVDGGSALGRRIARNTQTILQSEAHLWRVLDIAGGSYYVETLTDQLAAAAWAELQRIEAAGGLLAAIEAGLVHAALADVLAARDARVATRRQPLTGLSEFPDIDEAPPPAPAGRGTRPDSAFAPLALRRPADGFEAQRARADTHWRDTGVRPSVYLATLGTPAQFTARATFAKNLFEAGGIRTAAGPVGDFTGEQTGGVVCLCSSDPVYAEHAGDAAAALRAAGATRIYVAGRKLDIAGVDAEIGVGSDVLAVLAATLDHLGVAPAPEEVPA